MKAGLFIFVVLLLFTFRAFGQKDEKILYPSGKVALTRQYSPSCNCIKETGYYESGKRKSIRTFIKKGFPNGEVEEGGDTTFYENGVIAICLFCKDGAPDGRLYSNDADGKFAYEKFYANGYKSGTWKYYNSDKTLMQEEVYAENKTHWDSDSNYLTCKYYDHGKLVYTESIEGFKKTDRKIIDKEAFNRLTNIDSLSGKKLIEENCMACHGTNNDIVGPKLKGITKGKSDGWLTKMIVNASELRKSGDKDAIDSYKKWNQISHPNFERLSPEGVKAIIGYLKTLQ